MNSRLLLQVLLLGLFVLLATYAVLMAFYALVTSLGDPLAARVLFWVAQGGLIAAAIDLLLLVIVIGMRMLEQTEEERGE